MEHNMWLWCLCCTRQDTTFSFAGCENDTYHKEQTCCKCCFQIDIVKCPLWEYYAKYLRLLNCWIYDAYELQ